MRLFVALEVTERQKREICALQQDVKKYIKEARPVKPAGLHLTLKFLGETGETKVEKIKKAINEAAEPLSPFQLKYGGCGVFPSPGKARILWVGLKEGTEETCLLASRMEKKLASIGYEKEKRRYRPHLTIARFRDRVAGGHVRQFLEEQSCFESSAAQVNRVVLYESRLAPAGAEYTELYEKLLWPAGTC